jgi:DNA repair protein RadC
MEIKKKYLPITEWAIDDRPREKMLLKGVNTLSDAELIAILIRSGSREESAVDLAKRILNTNQNNLNQLAKLSLADLQKFKGIGKAKAISIVAALELGKRRRLEQALEIPQVSDSRTVYELLHPLMSDLQHEEFWVLYLNQSNKVIDRWLAGKGGITSTLVDVRLVLKKALEVGAVSIILSHNHPSGKREPSAQDRELTERMQEAARTLDIKVLDHIIIADQKYFSFADEGLFEV